MGRNELKHKTTTTRTMSLLHSYPNDIDIGTQRGILKLEPEAEFFQEKKLNKTIQNIQNF